MAAELETIIVTDSLYQVLKTPAAVISKAPSAIQFMTEDFLICGRFGVPTVMRNQVELSS